MQSNNDDRVAKNITFFQKFNRLVANVAMPLEDENQQLKEELEQTKKAFQQELLARTTQLEQTETKLQAVEKEKAEQETRAQALEAEICKLNQERNDCNATLLNLFDKLGSSYDPNANAAADSFSEERSPLENLNKLANLLGRGTTFKENEKDKALEASRQQIQAMKLDLEEVRKEKGELTLELVRAHERIGQMRNELAEQDGKMLEMRRKLSAMDEDRRVGDVGSSGGNGSQLSQQLLLDDINDPVLGANVSSRSSTGNVEHGASLTVEACAGAAGQHAHTGENIENDELPGPSRLAAISSSSPLFPISSGGTSNMDEVTAVQIKIEIDDQPEAILKHKKAPRSKAKNRIGLYPCICRKEYGSQKSLEDHQRHSKKKDLPCPYYRKGDRGTKCAQKFSNSSDFKLHCKREHGAGKARSICCSLCSQYFPRSQLHKHQKTKHFVDLTRQNDPKNYEQDCSSSNMNKKN